MKILITGGAGFIGAHTAKKLSELGHEIYIVDNFNDYYDPALKRARINEFLKGLDLKIYETDIRDYYALKKVFAENKINKILHLAAQAGVLYAKENPFIYAQTNVEGTLNLLELAKDFNVQQFVYASSSSVYGGNSKLPFSETDETRSPLSIYAATKIADELMAYTYHHLYKISCTGLRFFTVYGPWGRPDMALFKFTKNILAGEPIEVRGMSRMKRNFTYIEDVVSGIAGALENVYPYEIFNLGGDRSVDLKEYINQIEICLGKKAVKNYIDMDPSEVLETKADLTHAKEKLGYEPKVSVQEGVKKFIEWYKEYYLIK